jgi:hypothetical protein
MTGLAAHRSDCTSGLRSAQSRLPAGEKVGLKGCQNSVPTFGRGFGSVLRPFAPSRWTGRCDSAWVFTLGSGSALRPTGFTRARRGDHREELDNRVGSDGARATEAERTPVTQFRCVECGFAAARRAPERCPMCGGIVWEDEAWRPFSKRARPPWE